MRKRSKIKDTRVNTLDVESYRPLSIKDERTRIPPGQRKARSFPVFTMEKKVPKFNGKDWDVVVEGLVEQPVTWTWEQFLELPKTEQVSDLHCVTTWSLLDQKFSGVSFKSILGIVKPKEEAKYVRFIADSGYDTSIPLKDGFLLENDVLLAYGHDNKPLEAKHGGPLRLLVPQLYLWKSVKWLRKIEFTDQWHRGFWERNGYHQQGDPWNQERFSYQEPRE